MDPVSTIERVFKSILRLTWGLVKYVEYSVSPRWMLQKRMEDFWSLREREISTVAHAVDTSVL